MFISRADEMAYKDSCFSESPVYIRDANVIHNRIFTIMYTVYMCCV